MLSTARLVASLLMGVRGEEVRTWPPNDVCSRPVVVFSGTQTWRDLLLDDLNVRPRPWPPRTSGRQGSGMVHGGFACRTLRLADAMEEFIDKHDEYVLGGYSLGGACALLFASLLRERGKHVEAVYTFGVPQLASKRFQELYRRQGLWERTNNFYTPKDPIVTRIPYFYRRVGVYVELMYDGEQDWDHHEMQTYEQELERYCHRMIG